MVIALVALFVAVIFFVELLVGSLNRTAESGGRAEAQPVRGFTDLRLPRGLFVSEGHTWSRLAGSGEFEIGIDELISQAIDGADKVELPESGADVREGEPLATVWHRNRKLVIPSPLSGTVVTSNKTASRVPNSLAYDTYGSGWLVRLWPVDHKEALKQLRVGEDAHQWLGREVQRFSEFLAEHSTPRMVGAMAADGARPVIGAALSLDEAGWTEFGKEFAASR